MGVAEVNWWEVLTAIGTLLAVAVAAVWLGVAEVIKQIRRVFYD